MADGSNTRRPINVKTRKKLSLVWITVLVALAIAAIA